MLPNHNQNLYWVSQAYDLTGFMDIKDSEDRLIELQKLRSTITQEGIHSGLFDIQPIIGWKEVAGKLMPVLAYGIIPYESKKAWVYDSRFSRIIERDGRARRVSEWIASDILEPVVKLISKAYGAGDKPRQL